MVPATHRVRLTGLSRTLLVLGAVVLVGCQLAGLTGPAGAQRNDIGNRLAAWAATAKAGDSIALSNLTDFVWDRVLIGGPYFPSDAAKDDLGFDWDAEKLPSYTNDGLNFLAFVDRDHVAAWSTVGRTADIQIPAGNGAVVTPRASAVFVWDGNQLALASS